MSRLLFKGLGSEQVWLLALPPCSPSPLPFPLMFPILGCPLAPGTHSSMGKRETFSDL